MAPPLGTTESVWVLHNGNPQEWVDAHWYEDFDGTMKWVDQQYVEHPVPGGDGVQIFAPSFGSVIVVTASNRVYRLEANTQE